MRSATFWMLAVVLFLFAAGAGYVLRPFLEQRGYVQEVQPSPDAGWCCIKAGQCVAKQNSDVCFSAGGSAFNAHKDVCLSICQPS